MAFAFPEAAQVVDPAEAHINHLFDHLVWCLNQRRVELLDTARDTREEMAARPAARLRKEEELIAMRAETERRLAMNELRETQFEILAKLDEKLAEVRRPQPDTRVSFRGDSRELEQLIRGVGEVLEEEEVPAVPRYQEMRPIVAVAKQGGEPGELWGPEGVAIDSNTNQIYVAECSRVSIFSETGEFLNSISHEHMKYPWGVAIHRDNVYVTDNEKHFVFHFKLSADIRLVARLGGRGSGIGQFNHPMQLTVATNGDVFITDRDNHRIQILDSDLNHQRNISHHSMTTPYDVKLTPEEVFVISCYDSPCVHVFNYAGEKIRSLIPQGMEMQVSRPHFFCLDANENIIISDFGSHQIKIFSKEGTLLHALGEPGHGVGMFHSPQGVALTNNLKLVVVSGNNNYRLQIFACL